MLKDYFDEKEEQGFDFAYRYPGMNKVMQAGRPRHPHRLRDRGIILLAGRPFPQKRLSGAVSQGVGRIIQVVNVGNVSQKKLEAFWSRTGREESL